MAVWSFCVAGFEFGVCGYWLCLLGKFAFGCLTLRLLVDLVTVLVCIVDCGFSGLCLVLWFVGCLFAGCGVACLCGCVVMWVWIGYLF